MDEPRSDAITVDEPRSDGLTAPDRGAAIGRLRGLLEARASAGVAWAGGAVAADRPAWAGGAPAAAPPAVMPSAAGPRPGGGTPAIDLKRFMEPRARVAPGEACEFCTEPIAGPHSHVVDLEGRRLACACRGCWLLFAPDGAGGGRYRAVPEDVVLDPAFVLTDADWDALQVPVGMAFFFHQSDLGRPVAFYPGPAGATESLLELGRWDRIVADNPVLAGLRPDVEALLVRRPASGRPGLTFIVPIDACYELVGVIRRTWKGFDGGPEAAEAISAFFDRLSARSRPPAVRAREARS